MAALTRLTVDFPKEEHKYLKMACAKLETTMREFVMKAALDRLEELEDEWLAERSAQVIDDIESGKSKTIPWEEFKKEFPL